MCFDMILYLNMDHKDHNFLFFYLIINDIVNIINYNLNLIFHFLHFFYLIVLLNYKFYYLSLDLNLINYYLNYNFLDFF